MACEKAYAPFYIAFILQSVVDPATVVLPWAVDEIELNIKAITDTFGKIIIDPKTSIANIGNSATRCLCLTIKL